MVEGRHGQRASAAALPLLALALTAAACGGRSDGASTPAATSATASSTVGTAVPARVVEAATPAGTLHGECRGVVPSKGRSTARSSPTSRPFIAAAKLAPPVFLVGHSAGANVVFMYAQAHRHDVAGFVSMNPVPPAATFLRLARKVETEDEFRDETTFYDGDNEKGVSFHDTEQMLEGTLPATLPYAVMFDEDCDGDTAFCGRILPSLPRATRLLAARGKGGRFVAAKGAAHEIFATEQDLVLRTIDDVLADGGSRWGANGRL